MSDKVKSENRKKPLNRTNRAILPSTRTYLKQANTLTFGAYDFSQLQIKGFVVVIERLQEAMEELLNAKGQKDPLQLSIFDNAFEKEFQEIAKVGKASIFKENVIQFKIPLKEFGVTPNNYEVLKASLKSMQNIPVELDIIDEITNKSYTKITSLFEVIIENPQPYYDEKKGRVVTPRVNHVFIHMKQSVALSLLNLEKGFTKFVKEIVMKQSSKYTIRIYMLISALKKKGGFSIKYRKLCRMLGIEDEQYKIYSDFHKRVIRPAYIALHEKADVWFELSEVYKNDNDKIPDVLRFKVIHDRNSISQSEFEQKRQMMLDTINTHFHLSDFDLKTLSNVMNPENLQGFISVIFRIKDYCSKERIVNVAEYAYTSLYNELTKEVDIPDNI